MKVFNPYKLEEWTQKNSRILRSRVYNRNWKNDMVNGHLQPTNFVRNPKIGLLGGLNDHIGDNTFQTAMHFIAVYKTLPLDQKSCYFSMNYQQ